MKIQALNFDSTTHPHNDGFAMTPMMLAATMGRLSRSDKDLETIYEESKGKSPHSVMDLAGYGHASLADLVIIPIEFKDISVWMSATIFSFMKLYNAIEKSSRYVPFGFKPIWDEDIPQWEQWKEDSQAAKGMKGKDRIEFLDKVRYGLPLSSRTTLGIIASAREWHELCQILKAVIQRQVEKSFSDDPIPGFFYSAKNIVEVTEVYEALRATLIRYTDGFSYFRHFSTESTLSFMEAKDSLIRAKMKAMKDMKSTIDIRASIAYRNLDEEDIDDLLQGIEENDFASRNHLRENRYCKFHPFLDSILLEWNYFCTFAEFRDLNRHRDRIGQRQWCFVDCSKDKDMGAMIFVSEKLTLSQFLYTCELRTGPGAHESYRKIMNDSFYELRSSPITMYGGEPANMAEILDRVQLFMNQTESEELK